MMRWVLDALYNDEKRIYIPETESLIAGKSSAVLRKKDTVRTVRKSGGCLVNTSCIFQRYLNAATSELSLSSFSSRTGSVHEGGPCSDVRCGTQIYLQPTHDVRTTDSPTVFEIA